MVRSLFLLSAFIIAISTLSFKPITDTCAISGIITDGGDNLPLPGVVVQLYKGDSAVSTLISNINGAYCFKNINPGSYKLVAMGVGFDRFERLVVVYNVGDLLTENIELKSAVSLKECVVTATHVKREKKSLGYAVQNINGLTAKVSGVVVNAGDNGRRSNAYWNQNTSNKPVYNTENYAKIDDNNFKKVKKQPLSTFSIDVDKASYSNVRRFINQGTLPPPDAVRVEEMINYFSYDYPQPTNEHPFSITTEYTDCPWNTQHKLVHIGLQGKQINMERLPANNLVFLLDVSGSMDDPAKLPLVKSGLRLLIEQLRPEDRVAIVVYAGAAGLVLPSTSGNQKEKIVAALEQLSAGGSTAGGEGLELAYTVAQENFQKEGNNRVILATDGDFNVGVSSEGDLVRLIEEKREQGVFLTVLGFGTGNYQDAKMEQLADKGNGNYAYVDNLLEAKKVLVKEMGGTLFAIAKDVKIQVEFNPVQVKAYRLIGYENRALNDEDFNDDKKDAGELGAGHTVTALYEIIPASLPEEVASVDSLKYQQTETTRTSFGNEILTIKFRYKRPQENRSNLITHVVYDEKKEFKDASENCRFSTAVVEFGLLLRQSSFKGVSSWDSVREIARSAKGEDKEGYRAEFIRLVEMAELLHPYSEQ